MGGLRQLIEVFTTLSGVHLKPWMGPAGLLIAIAVFWPWIRVNLRTGDARKLLVRAARERGAARQRLEAEALAMVGTGPDGLVVVAKEALEQGRKELAAQAIVKLRATGKRLPDLRKLERALEPPLPGTPAEAAIVIERMLETGMRDEARARLAQARRKWPFDGELESLEAQGFEPAPERPPEAAVTP
ncbi:MAG: hypothetical protein Q8P18_20685 [Pseudomonadota bacterium]|nr:hypothetical protein [Pseudomonadota bacterium]